MSQALTKTCTLVYIRSLNDEVRTMASEQHDLLHKLVALDRNEVWGQTLFAELNFLLDDHTRVQDTPHPMRPSLDETQESLSDSA